MRKSVSSLLAVLVVSVGLVASSGTALAGDNNGNDGGIGGNHNHDSHGLVGGVLNGNCNVNVNVLGSSRCNNTDNYVGGAPGVGWESDSVGYYPTLYNESELNLAEYGYTTMVPVCHYPSWGAFESFARPHLRGRFNDLRGRFGRTVGAWNTGWDRVRHEGGCTPTVTYQPTFVEQGQPAIYSPTSGAPSYGGSQVARPSSPSVNTGDGSTAR